MTLEEAQAKIAELEAQAQTTATKLNDLLNSRNTSALQRHAMAAVLKAHNITFDADKADLSALTVGDDGAVAGEFAYTPPAVANQQQQSNQQQQQQQQQKGAEENQQQQQQQQAQGLTLEDVKAMSEDQINERWDEVSAVLESQKGE